MLQHIETLERFFSTEKEKVLRDPQGSLRYRYLEPGSVYSGQLWDWDSFYTGLALLSMDVSADYLKGSALNFLDNLAEDDSIPYHVFVEPEKYIFENSPYNAGYSKREKNSPFNSCKPILAQMCAIAAIRMNDYTWVAEAFERLERYIKHWENEQRTDQGLFVWRSHRGSGADNHPGVYGRPFNSSAGIDLNTYFVREYEAMAHLAGKIGDSGKAGTYKGKALSLGNCINTLMWDPIDGMYYHLDMLTKEMENTNQKVSWTVPLKFRAWTAFMPLWAEVAPKEYAERMIEKHLVNKDEFWAGFGVRTLAKNEPLYNLSACSNPSNWQGPVWIVSNYIVFRALMNYGYKELAEELMGKTMELITSDIEKSGAMHEYYNPDTGEPIKNPGFINWNLLVYTMWREINDMSDYTKFK